MNPRLAPGVLVVLVLVAPRPAAAQARAAAPPRPATALKLTPTATEIRLETTAYVLRVTRDGFGWTLERPGGQQVLTSAPAAGPTPNGALVVDGVERTPGKLKNVERADDRVLLEYDVPAKKTALHVEIEPLPDRVRVTTIGLHRDPGLGALVS